MLSLQEKIEEGTCQGLENKVYVRFTGGSRIMMLNFSFSFFSVLSRSTRKLQIGKQNKTKQKEKQNKTEIFVLISEQANISVLHPDNTCPNLVFQDKPNNAMKILVCISMNKKGIS